RTGSSLIPPDDAIESRRRAVQPSRAPVWGTRGTPRRAPLAGVGSRPHSWTESYPRANESRAPAAAGRDASRPGQALNAIEITDLAGDVRGTRYSERS